MHMRTKALVRRAVDYKESDKILTLLTQESGKLTASARGCRKKGSPVAAGVQLLAWSDLVLYEYRGRWTVKAAVEREFLGLRRDVERLALACYFAEAAEALAVEDVPAPELLSLVLNSLYALDQMPQKPLALVKAAFELRLMCAAGYEPILDGCAVCGAIRPLRRCSPLRFQGRRKAVCFAPPQEFGTRCGSCVSGRSCQAENRRFWDPLPRQW